MGNPNVEDSELWGEEAAAFIASAPGGYGPGWVGKRPLGQGGFGRAGLWELLDDEGNVQQVWRLLLSRDRARPGSQIE